MTAYKDFNCQPLSIANF